MDTNTQSTTNAESEILIERPEEMQQFASLLPLNEFTMRSSRVYNLWGEHGVGKSTFISAFQKSDTVHFSKILWITPRSSESIDTPQEFIAACSKGVSYFREPEREQAIAKKLDESQHGKLDPLRSDDAILIIRSSVTNDKKPYINAAAASSVGRTSFVRDDLEVSLGFGINRSEKQAEAFLDALPLQSMGTDLVILYLPHVDLVSKAVKDWFRDYVIPAASKGPFRRNLVVLTETHEPLEFNALDYSFGEWDEQAVDYQLLPANEDCIYQYAVNKGCSSQEARFVFIKSLGYPRIAQDAVERSTKNNRDRNTLSHAISLFSALPSSDKAKLAACCLPDKLYPIELDAIFDNGNGQDTISWLASLPGIPLTLSPNESSYRIPDDFRFIATNSIQQDSAFDFYKDRWLPYGRLMHAVPAKSDRSKLYLLASLSWIENEICDSLFDENAENVLSFMDAKQKYFVKRFQRTRISERLRQDLCETVNNMGHSGISSLRKQAQTLWNDRCVILNQNLEDLEKSITSLEKRMQRLLNRNAQLSSLLKNINSGSRTTLNPQALAQAENNHHGTLITLCLSLSSILFVVGQISSSPTDLIGNIAGTAFVGISLILTPGWRRQRLAKTIRARSKIKGSQENLRKESHELAQQIHSGQNAQNELQREIEQIKETLLHPYV
jgi:hypothetical protein